MTDTVAKPTIGIIGTGAIGGFYGLMLARAGFDVHFFCCAVSFQRWPNAACILTMRRWAR